MTTDNQLLAGLPADARQRLRPHLQEVSLERGQSLFESGEPVRYAFFPTTGLVALAIESADGHALELASVGREGMIGLPIFLRDDAPQCRAVVRVGSRALRLSARALIGEFALNGPLRDALLEYSGRIFRSLSQASLCHRSHSVLQRLCTWLLATTERTESDTIQVTQETLTEALGANRSAISKAVAELQDADAVWSRPGYLMVRARTRIQVTACECYETLRCLRQP